MPTTLHDAPVISPEPVLTPEQMAANRARTKAEFEDWAAKWDRMPAS